eukprot:gnl/TRDRNA2_/TRDRNA2_155105_c2_seq1.p1 gnl/TRDRNA2_/TRDRNA2_155105_c2~~gnl/TRDRNA2_/TRDRNA2_155105_c2_seq1.p1  ORF type:complete len:429 (+),score=46.07 gnl/TRDRNA2_/TRDRNA2_155105_c2_seq1:125-1288(+)
MLPVLGRRSYEEELRIVMYRDKAIDALAVQVSANLSIGFPVGDYQTELLHIYSQEAADRPICLNSFGLAQPGRAQKPALQGMREKQLQYIAIARSALSGDGCCSKGMNKANMFTHPVPASVPTIPRLSKTSLPQRVNIVFGGRFALAKTAWGDCPVDVAPAHEVLTNPRDRRSGNNKWLLKVDDGACDDTGRPIFCIIRNDHHPQRSLRAGEPVLLDNTAFATEHRWKLKYIDDSLIKTSAVGSPFYIQSTWTDERRYLAVDETTRRVIMQKELPQLPWEFYDAAGATQNLTVKFHWRQTEVHRAPKKDSESTSPVLLQSSSLCISACSRRKSPGYTAHPAQQNICLAHTFRFSSSYKHLLLLMFLTLALSVVVPHCRFIHYRTGSH